MRRFLRRLPHELFAFDAPETAGERLHVRLVEVFVVAYAVFFCWTWGAYLGEIEGVLLPLGVANYLDVSFMFEGARGLWNAGLVTVFCALGLARVWKPAYAVAILLFHLQYASRYSLGEISHGSNLIGMGLLGLAIGALVFDGAERRRRFLMGYLFFFIGLGYTSAAVCKLVGTGPLWPMGYHLWMWIGERSVDVTSRLGTFEPNALQRLVLDHPHVGTLFLTFGLVTEASGVLAWWRRPRYLVLCGLVVLHVGIAVTMNIFFEATTYFLVLIALPWGALLDSAWARLRPATASSAGLHSS